MTDLFIPKPFAEIVAGMVEQMRSTTDRVTDFNVGSVVRALLEANAVELDDYYQAVYMGLLQAIPTAVYLGFGFERRGAVCAAGRVTITRNADDIASVDLSIPAGTLLVGNGGQRYALADDVLLTEVGGSVSAVAVAVAAGAAGNTAAHTVLQPAIVGTSRYSVDNPAAMAGGLDEETDSQRAERFSAYILSLSRGTVAALEYAATEPAILDSATGVAVERVQRASVDETAGHVSLYIHNGSYGASAALIAAVQTWIDGYRDPADNQWVGGYRPAGMRVEVLALIETPVSVGLELVRLANADESALTLAVRAAVEALVRAALPGQRVRPIDLLNAALGVDGVLGGIVLAPTAAVEVPANAILYLDALDLVWTA